MTKQIWDDERVEKIVGQVDKGWSVLAVAWPTRAFRIVVNELGLMFRVQQLDTSRAPHSYSWRTVSSHQGDRHFESYPSAIKDMLGKQTKFKEMVKLKMHERKMAEIKANAPIGVNQ